MPERMSISTKVIYRQSAPSDLQTIAELEALSNISITPGLSEALLSDPADTLSFIAELDNKVIGHILLTAITGPDRALALAPLAILPPWRDMQIGTELVRHALHQAREQGWKSVFVSGQPDYYCRFGFRSHTADCASIDWQGPRFLALELELEKGALENWAGPLGYPDAFSDLFRARQQ